MSAKISIKIPKGYTYGVINKEFNRYDFRVGIFDDEARKKPKSKNAGLKNFFGMQARKTGKKSNSGISSVAKQLSKKYKWLRKPFNSSKNKEVLFFFDRFIKSINGKADTKRVENALLAIVRNPIYRGDYGKNKASTVKAKGFNKPMVDTGQFFKKIKAKVLKRQAI